MPNMMQLFQPTGRKRQRPGVQDLFKNQGGGGGLGPGNAGPSLLGGNRGPDMMGLTTQTGQAIGGTELGKKALTSMMGKEAFSALMNKGALSALMSLITSDINLKTNIKTVKNALSQLD